MNLERSIAGKAKDLVREQVGRDHEIAYRSLCESFPILLRSAGLAQTVAYLRAKWKKQEYGVLYDHLQHQFRSLDFLGEKDELSEKASDPTLSQADYRVYSEVAMKAALWHKRMAQALLKKRDQK